MNHKLITPKAMRRLGRSNSLCINSEKKMIMETKNQQQQNTPIQQCTWRERKIHMPNLMIHFITPHVNNLSMPSNPTAKKKKNIAHSTNDLK